MYKPSVVKSEYISICIVCMNRLFHIRETLPESINANKNYKNVEFLLLDYNSSDGLEKWVKTKMMKHVENGRLKYYRTVLPKFFDICHSKNMAVCLSSSKIVSLLDADNYAGEGYVSWVNEIYNDRGFDSIITTIRKDYIPYRDVGGKIVFNKGLFMKARGFDESLNGYGFDDVDLVNRLEMNGGKRVFIENSNFLKCIGHTDIERISNNILMHNINNIYVIIENSKKHLLYLLNNKSFMIVTYHYNESFIKDQFLSYNGWYLDELYFNSGVLIENEFQLELIYADCTRVSFTKTSSHIKNNENNEIWSLVQDSSVSEYVMMYSECSNRNIFKRNNLGEHVNFDGFGRGTVFFNFMNQPLDVSYDGAISF